MARYKYAWNLEGNFDEARRKLAGNLYYRGNLWAAMSAMTGVSREDTPRFAESEIASLFEVDTETVNYLIVLDERARSIAAAVEHYLTMREAFGREVPIPNRIADDGQAAHEFSEDELRRLRPRMVEMNTLLLEAEAMIDENLAPSKAAFVRLSARTVSYFQGLRVPRFDAIA